MPVLAGPVQLTGLPMLEVGDLPSFVLKPGVYLAFVELLTNIFSELDKADEMLINSFYELETKVKTLISILVPYTSIFFFWQNFILSWMCDFTFLLTHNFFLCN